MEFKFVEPKDNENLFDWLDSACRISSTLNRIIITSSKCYTKGQRSILEKTKGVPESIETMPRSRFLYMEKLIDSNIKDRNGVLTYLMLNPSYADCNKNDPTVNRARKWAQKIEKEDNTGYEYFAIINVYPYRCSEAETFMKKIYNDIDKTDMSINLEFVQKFLNFQEIGNVVLAYGKHAREEDIVFLKNLEKEFYTFFQDTNDDYSPRHLLSTKSSVYSKKDNKLHLYKLESYMKGFKVKNEQ